MKWQSINKGKSIVDDNGDCVAIVRSPEDATLLAAAPELRDHLVNLIDVLKVCEVESNSIIRAKDTLKTLLQGTDPISDFDRFHQERFGKFRVDIKTLNPTTMVATGYTCFGRKVQIDMTWSKDPKGLSCYCETDKHWILGENWKWFKP